MKKEEILKTVEELNQHLFDVIGDDVEHRFNYQTDGYVEVIYFDEVQLYNSENDILHSVDHEPRLKDFVMQKFNDYIDSIKLVRFKLPETEVGLKQL